MYRKEILKIIEQINTEMLLAYNIKTMSVISEATLEAALILKYIDEKEEIFRLYEKELKYKLLDIIRNYNRLIRLKKMNRVLNEKY